MPTYYIMDLDKGMAETVASVMPTAAEIAACKWLPDNELAVYAAEYEGRDFRVAFRAIGVRAPDPPRTCKHSVAARLTYLRYLSAASDWGVFQSPGAFETMQNKACTQMRGAHLIDGAGHWLEQEQPEQVSKLLQFLQDASAPDRKL